MLPAVSSPALKRVLLLLICACAAIVGNALLLAWNGRYLPLALSVVLWLPLVWGLWMLHPLARKVTVGLLWMVVLILPIGVINPFAAMDGAINTDVPLWRLALPVFGIVGLALFALHILGKHKAEFGRHV
jgi:hypothetical protein